MRSAFFICVSAVVPSVAVYQLALLVSSTLASVKLQPHDPYAPLSTLIWLLICVLETAPPLPLPSWMRWTCTAIGACAAAAVKLSPCDLMNSATSRSICALVASSGSIVAQPRGDVAEPGSCTPSLGVSVTTESGSSPAQA